MYDNRKENQGFLKGKGTLPVLTASVPLMYIQTKVYTYCFVRTPTSSQTDARYLPACIFSLVLGIP